MKANYHTHTQRCRHAQGTEEDYILCAMASGLEVLGFSDHAPFPDVDYGYRMPFDELPLHFQEVDRLTQAYRGRIAIRKGLEIEYLPQYRGYYEDLLGRCRVDYLLLGEHFFPDAQGETRFVSNAESTEEFILYARGIEAALKTGYFCMVAHPDLFTMDHFPWDSNCDRASDIILNAAAVAGCVLEYNANGYRRGIHAYPDGERLMYPHARFWRKVKESGLPVIVGSDCHEPCQVWDDCLPRARQDLSEMGIVPLDDMEGRFQK